MNKFRIPDNIKIHFAGLESRDKAIIATEMGINYGLYSAFQFVYKKIFGKRKSLCDLDFDVIRFVCKKMNHVIQDSGLFSLLYGAKKDLMSKQLIYKWYDALVEFTIESKVNASVVEIDCQDILGDDIAWDLRQRLKNDLPNNRIINVFHLSDGIKGLDRLIEFSDYIAVGSSTPSDSSYSMFEVSSYIKNKNSDIDIHLLGCTIPNTLNKCRFCSSADSTTWFRSIKYGDIKKYHINDLDTNKVRKLVGNRIYENVKNVSNEVNANAFCASVEMYKRLFEMSCGNQDYTKHF